LSQDRPDPLMPQDLTPLVWDQNGVPRSSLYGDVYFSAENGLAESEAVFLKGCNLPEAWADRDRFVVGELGLGTGLNLLALIRLWRRHRPKGGHLHIFTIEAHPLSEAQARRALAAWPEISDLAESLLAQWPGQARGFHRICLPDLGVFIDIAIMEALSALRAWDGRANAWFLDGFSPATNPQMWRPEVLEQIATHSAPGAVVATFTVAGAVRRGLAEQGFAVAKRPGFGRKRERLEAIWPGPAAPSPPPPRPDRIAIIGAGIAGAALARAFARLGMETSVYDQIGPGAGGSGNPAALVTPRLDLGDGASAHLYAQGFDHAVRSYEREIPEAILDQGVLQLEIHPADQDRFDRLVDLDLFETDDLLRLTAAQASQHLGQAQDRGGLMIQRAVALHPAAVLKAWLPKVYPAKIASLGHEGGAWALRDANGAVIALADCVCIAAGAGTSDLATGLPLQIVRGQVSLAQGPVTTRPISASGYAIPMPGGVLFGATHDRDQTSTETRAIDNQRNLAQLSGIMPSLAAQIDPDALDARASLRAAGLDHLPVAGALEGQDGVFVLGGLGARGFTLSPLLAEHIAAMALGHPSPLPHWVGQALEPSRFERRRLKRQAHANPSLSGNRPRPELGLGGQ